MWGRRKGIVKRAKRKDTEYVEEDIKRKQQETWREKFFHSLFPLSAFFSALWMVRMALTPFWSRPRVTNSNHTMSELSCLSPSTPTGLEIIIIDCSPPDALQVKQVVSERLCLPSVECPQSPHFLTEKESLLMKELLSLRRGRGAIKMKTNGEVGRTGRWEGRMSHL